MGLREFHEKRNKILFIRGCGGLGDILMHRMMFEDFKLLMPDAEIHFACPAYYHPAVSDHPFIDKVLNTETLNRFDYNISYNTTTACGRTEMKLAPSPGPNRSDIWAEHCGISLTRHNMHFRLTDEEKQEGKRLIESVRDRSGPVVIVAPVSAMQNKNLQDKQLLALVEGIYARGCCVVGIHNNPIPAMFKKDIPVLSKLGIRQWLGVLDQCDYVVSVDTAALHAAGGLGKPTTGVFTFVNGPAYTKYYANMEIVQGGCPLLHAGCYNWTECPDKAVLKPCLTGITADMILFKVDRMLEKYPR